MKIKNIFQRAVAWARGKKFFDMLIPTVPGEAIFFRDNYRQFSVEGYEKNVYVNKSINEIATTVAGIPWILTDRTGKEIESHPLLDLLARPNPTMSRSAFFIWLVSYFLIDGNEFILSVSPDPNGRRPPLELWPLQPNWIELKPGGRGKPTREFRFKNKDGTTTPIPPDMVMHIKTFNPLSPFIGLSPIRAARFSITQGNESKKWNVSLLQNHARPAGAFITKGNVQPQQRTRIKEEMEEKWTGSANAGRPLFLEGGFEWTQFSLNAADMDWLEGQKISAREIALIFGVPPELIGDVSNKTYSNYKEARRAFYQETILPFMEFLKDELNSWLVPKFGDNLILDFDTDQVVALQEDRDLLFKRLNEATFLTDNEKREIAGFEPVKGGDVILKPLNLVPLGFAQSAHDEEEDDDKKKGGPLALEYKQGREVQSLILSKERFPTKADAREWVLNHDFKAPKVDEKPDSWRFRQFPPGRCDEETIRTTTITRGVQAIVCVAKEGRACDLNGHEKAFNLKTTARKRMFWKQFDRRRAGFFGRVEVLIAQQLRADFRAAQRAVESSTASDDLSEAAGAAIFGNQDKWAQLFERIYVTVGDDFARDVFSQFGEFRDAGGAPQLKAGGIITKPTLAIMGDGGPEAIIPLAVLRAMKNDGTTIVRKQEPIGEFRDLWLEEIRAWLGSNGTIRQLGILDTTTRGVRKVIADGIGEGLATRTIAKRIQEFSEVRVAGRARLIAQTEVISASNLGSVAAANATGLPLKKEWIATADERVRDAHADADGQVVEGTDGAFSIDGEELLFPGDTSLGATGANIFNCRCTVGYIPVDSDDNVPVAGV